MLTQHMIIGLTWVLSARQIYPQSEFASEGILRVIDQILPEDGSSEDLSVNETETSSL